MAKIASAKEITPKLISQKSIPFKVYLFQVPPIVSP